ncbi:MAG TPA: hypothetical protein VHD61_09360, partial [Lacunisphaera sp.]|nr:hypothetical protein [Lacunisphaera sp.]
LNVRENMNPAEFPDFTNKLLTVHVASGQHNYIVFSPVFRLQAGRWFLVGNTPKGVSTGDWDQSIEVALAWDQVSAYRVFDSTEHYVERYAKFREFRQKP